MRQTFGEANERCSWGKAAHVAWRRRSRKGRRDGWAVQAEAGRVSRSEGWFRDAGRSARLTKMLGRPDETMETLTCEARSQRLRRGAQSR